MDQEIGKSRPPEEIFDASAATVLEMIEDRGWSAPSVHVNTSVMLNALGIVRELLLSGDTRDPHKRYLLVMLMPIQDSASNFNKSIFDTLFKPLLEKNGLRGAAVESIHRVTIVAPLSCTSSFVNTIHATLREYLPHIAERHVQLLFFNEVCFNKIRCHELVPVYRLVPKQAQAEKLQRYLPAQSDDLEACKRALPKICTSDPVAKYFFALPGQLLESTAPCPSALETTEISIVE